MALGVGALYLVRSKELRVDHVDLYWCISFGTQTMLGEDRNTILEILLATT